MSNPSTYPERSPFFKNIHRRNIPESTRRKVTNHTIERLATPKQKDSRWIPDRPSVYWLDYIIDPTPHKLTNSEELTSYYSNFEPRFPRTKLLSAPRSQAALNSEESQSEYQSRPISVHTGIPISALTYTPSERIKELARPKTSLSKNGGFSEISSSSSLRCSTASRQSVSNSGSLLYSRSSLPSRPPLPSRSYSPKGQVRYFDPNVDLARGDFPSRSKHEIHAKVSSQERAKPTVTAPNSTFKLSSRCSSYHKTGSTVTRNILRNEKNSQRPMSRTLYS